MLFAVFNDEGHDVKTQTLFQRDKPPNATVAVLKRVDLFKLGVKGDDVV